MKCLRTIIRQQAMVSSQSIMVVVVVFLESLQTHRDGVVYPLPIGGRYQSAIQVEVHPTAMEIQEMHQIYHHTTVLIFGEEQRKGET